MDSQRKQIMLNQNYDLFR